MTISQRQIYDLVFADVSTAEAAGRPSEICFVEETNSIYQYVINGSSYTVDHLKVLATGNGGDTRWVVVAGDQALTSVQEHRVPFGDSEGYLTTSDKFTFNAGTFSVLTDDSGTDRGVVLKSDLTNNSGVVTTPNNTTSLELRTNGTTAISIDPTGYVGVGGILDPNTVLHIEESAPHLQLSSSAASGDSAYIDFANQNTIQSQIQSNLTDQNLIFKTGGTTTALTIDSSQRVGVNRTPTVAPLEVQTNAGAEAIRIIGRDNGTVDETNISFFHNDASTFHGAIVGKSSGLTLQGGTTEAMRIDSAGLVGIGTSTLSDTFTVASSFPAIRITDTSDNGYARILANANSLQIQADGGNTIADSHILFAIDGSEKVRIDSSGNVGIGNSSLENWASAYTALQIGGNASLMAKTTQAAGGDLYLYQNAYYDGADVKYISTDEASSYHQINGNHFFRVAASGTADTAISWSIAMTIDNSGNVGIGTTSPEKILHVKDGDDGLSVSGQGEIVFENNAGMFVGFQTPVSTYKGFFFNEGTDGDGAQFRYAYTGTASESRYEWRGNASEWMRLQDGNLGIGVTPTSLLHVQATQNSNWAVQIDNQGTTSAHGLYVNIGASSTGIPFRADKGGSPLAQISNDGYLGIGPTSPNCELYIKGAGAATPVVKLVSDVENSYPSLRFINDTNQWIIYAPDGSVGDGFSIYDATAVAYRFTIDTSGNVGIGKNPLYTLDVKGDINTTGVYRVNGVEQSGSGYWTLGTGSDIYRLSGNVGIGTTTPDTKLHVVDSNALLIKIETTDAVHTGLDIRNTVKAWNQFVNSSGDMQWDAGSVSNILYLENSGNVGIGEISPSGRLHVKAGESGLSSFNTSGDDFIFENDVSGGMTLACPDDKSAYIMFANASNNHSAGFEWDYNAETNGILKIRTNKADAQMSFLTGASFEAMRIDSDGNVGIGDTTPTYKLDVDGSFRFYNSSVGNSQIYSYAPTVSSNDTNYYIALSLKAFDYNINTGVTDSGYRVGLFVDAYVSDTDFLGTLNNQYAINARHGHYTGSAGHINNSYGVYIDTLLSGSTTVDNLWGLYQNNSNVKNYFAGSVGIGTNSPTDTFQVIGRTSSLYVRFTHDTGSGGINLGQSATDDSYLNMDNNNGNTKVCLRSNGYSHFTGGYVGIGTITPAKIFSVQNSGVDTEGIALYRNTGDGTLMAGLGQDADGHGEVTIYNTSGIETIRLRAGGTDSYFNSGSVGIGTTNVLSLLTVDQNNTNAIPTNANIAIGDDKCLVAYNSNNSGVYSSIGLTTRATSGSRVIIGLEHKSDYNGDMFFRIRNGASSSIEAMRIKSTGNIGINETDPVTKFQINQDSTNTVLTSLNNKSLLLTNYDITTNNYISLEFRSKDTGGTPRAGATISGVFTDRSASMVQSELAFLTRDVSGTVYEAMRIDATGQVGIGRENPSNALHVYHASINNVAKFESGDPGVGILFGDNNTSNNPVVGAITDDFYISTGGSEKVRINSAGNVGIGTASPQYKLSVGTTSDKIGYYDDATHYAYIEPYNSSTANFTFKTVNSAGGDFIFNGANVGIGIASPASELHVNSSGTTVVTIDAPVGYNAFVNFYKGNASNCYVGFRNSLDSIVLGDGTDRLVINDSGNVGIGVTSLESWLSTFRAIQLGGNCSLMANADTGANNQFNLCQNAYYDGAWKYQDNDEATRYYQGAGNHYFSVCASGTEDTAITWTEALMIDNSGNVGIGNSSLESWASVYNALQIGGNASLIAATGTGAGKSMYLSNNAYYDTTWRYISTDVASSYRQLYGDHTFRVAASGTADTAIPWINALHIANEGNVGIGNDSLESWDSDFTALQIGGNASIMAHSDTGDSNGLFLCQNMYYDGSWKYQDTDEASLYHCDSGRHTWYVVPSGTADTVLTLNAAMRIDNAGKIIINNTTADALFHIDDNGITGENILFRIDADDSSPWAFMINNKEFSSAGTDGLGMFVSTTGISSIYYNGTGATFRIANDAGTKLTIDDSGNVGIGTTSPDNGLHIYRDGPGVSVEDNSGPKVRMYAGDSSGYVGTTTAHDFAIRSNGSPRIYIESSGDIGIGTTSPQTNVHVFDTDGSGIRLECGANNNTNEIDFKSSSGRTGRIISSYTNPASITETYIAFHANKAGDANDIVDEVMRIAGNKVGIGTSSPSSYADSADALVIYKNGHSGLTIASSTTDNGSIFFADGTTGSALYAGYFQYYHSTDKMYIGTGGSPRVAIDNSGNVGIGTSSPTDKLHVIGDLKVENTSSQSNVNIHNLNVTSNSTNYRKALSANSTNISIDSGITDGGYRIGFAVEGYVNNAEMLGTLNSQYGIWCRHGHNSSAAGHINNSYGLYIDTLLAGSTTITNLYALYQNNSSAKNYFAGDVGAGVIPSYKLHVEEDASGFASYIEQKQGDGNILRLVASASDNFASEPAFDVIIDSATAFSVANNGYVSVGDDANINKAPLVIDPNNTGTYTASTTFDDGAYTIGYDALKIYDDNASSNKALIGFLLRDSAAGCGSFGLVRTGSSQGSFVWQLRDESIANDVAGSHREVMRLDHDGYLGIGGTPSALLDAKSDLTGSAGSHANHPVIRLTQGADASYNIGDIHSEIQFYTLDSGGFGPGVQASIRCATTRGNGISNPDAGLQFWATNGSGNLIEMLELDPNAAKIITTHEFTGSKISTGDGSVSAPSFTFSGDENTGIYRVNNDQLGIATGGGIRLLVDDNSVRSYKQYWGIDGDVSTPGFTFTNDPDTGIYRTGSGDFSFATNGSLHSTFNSTGIGIGATPSADVHITRASGTAEFRAESSDTASNTRFEMREDANNRSVISRYHSTHGNTDKFYIEHQVGGSWVGKIVIDASGNVGIGNANPTSYHSSAYDLVVGSTGESGITVVSGTSNNGAVYFADGTSDSERYRGYINYAHSADYMTLGTAGTNKFKIDSAGAVFIADSANAKSTIGLTINQGANDDEILSFKSSDVAHGMTDLAETDTYGTFKKHSTYSALGGLEMNGFSEGSEAIQLVGYGGATVNAVTIRGYIKSGTNYTNMSGDDNILNLYGASGVSYNFGGDGQATIDQGSYDGDVLTFKSSDIAHGMTDLGTTDTFGHFKKMSAADGGLFIRGITEGAFGGVHVWGVVNAAAATYGTVRITGSEKSGTTATAIGDTDLLLTVDNHGTVKFKVEGNGDILYDGTASAFDTYDDAIACADLSNTLSGKHDEFIKYNKKELTKMGVVKPTEDQLFVSTKNMNMLQLGAITEIYGVLEIALDKLGLSYSELKEDFRSKQLRR